MKIIKHTIILWLLILLNSCENKTYYLKYVVFYPSHNDTVEVSNTSGYYWGSNRGSNYIKEGSITGNSIYNGSAPYKIISYEYEENIK